MPSLFDMFKGHRSTPRKPRSHRIFTGKLDMPGEVICPGCPDKLPQEPPQLPKMILPQPGHDSKGNETKTVSIVDMGQFKKNTPKGPKGLF